jgi:hypothetical protein
MDMTELLAKFIIFAALVVVMMPLLLVCVLHIIAVTLVFTEWGVKRLRGITKRQRKNS